MREGSNDSADAEEQLQLLSLATCFQEREEGEFEMAPRDIDKLNDELKELKEDFKEHREDLGAVLIQVTKIESSINALTDSLKNHLCHCIEFRKERKEFEGEIERQIVVCPESENIKELKASSEQIKGSLKFWGIILSLICFVITIATVMTNVIYKPVKPDSKQEK